MSQEKWNNRYLNTPTLPQPNRMLAAWRGLLPRQGLALDLACGLGQNAFTLASNTLNFECWDVSNVAVDSINARAQKKGASVTATCVDVIKLATAQWPLQAFDLIIVSAFLVRDICPQIEAALKPGGILFYQTFNDCDTSNKPSNPHFLLKEDELLQLFSAMTPLVYLDSRGLDLRNNYEQRSHPKDIGSFGSFDTDDFEQSEIDIARSNRGKALLIAQKPLPS